MCLILPCKRWRRAVRLDIFSGNAQVLYFKRQKRQNQKLRKMAGKGEKKRNTYSVELEQCTLTQTIRFHSSIVRKKRRKQLIPCCNQLTSYYLPEFINFIYSFLDLPRVVQLRGHDRRYGLHPWHYRKNTAVTLANETTYRRANESVSHSYIK